MLHFMNFLCLNSLSFSGEDIKLALSFGTKSSSQNKFNKMSKFGFSRPLKILHFQFFHDVRTKTEFGASDGRNALKDIEHICPKSHPSSSIRQWKSRLFKKSSGVKI